MIISLVTKIVNLPALKAELPSKVVFYIAPLEARAGHHSVSEWLGFTNFMNHPFNNFATVT